MSVPVRIPGADSIDPVAPARDPGVQASPEDFGAGIGASMANMGAAAVSLGAHLYNKQQDAQDQVYVQTHQVSMAPAIAQAQLDAQQKFPDGGPEYMQALNTGLQQANDGVTAGLAQRGLQPSKAAQARVDTQFAGMQADALVKGVVISNNQKITALQTTLDDNTKLLASQVLSGGMNLDDALKGVEGNATSGKSLWGASQLVDQKDKWQHAVINAAIDNKYKAGDRAGGDAISAKYYGNVPKFGDSNAAAVTNAANELGIAPRNLAAVMSYETGGRFDPNMMGGKGGNYQGLIQFGPEERAKYGVKPGMTFAEQMPAVENYLRDRGVKPGMGLAQIYSIVNAGSLDDNGQPRWAASDGNGNIASHVQNIQRDHYANADKFLSGAGAGGAKSVQVAGADGSVSGQPNGDQNNSAEPILPDMAAALYWRQQSHAVGIDQERQDKIQKIQAQKVSDTAENGYLKDLFTDQPQTTVRQIVNDNSLNREAKERMIGIANRALKDDPLAARSQQATMGLITRMRLPDGDPQKITDVNPIYKEYTDGNLSRTDFEFASKQFAESVGPDGSNLMKLKTAFVKNAGESIGLANLGSSMTGGGGTFQKYNFERYVDKRVADYRAQQKDPSQLFDPNSNDYLGKLDSNGKPAILKPFLKDAQQGARDEAATITSAPAAISSLAERQRLDEWLRKRGGAPAAPIPASIVPVSQ